MSQMFCLKHQREPTIYDMETHELICERCALFDPQHRHHCFIDSDRLESTASKLCQELLRAMEMLGVNVDTRGRVWSSSIKELSLKKKSQDIAFISQTYDAKIKEIQLERQCKIHQIESEVSIALEETERSIQALVGEQYCKLLKQCQALSLSLNNQDYASVVKMCHEKQVKQRVSLLQKHIEWAILDFSNKLNFLCKDSQPTLTKKASKLQHLLVHDLQQNFTPLFDSLKESRASTKSDLQTEISFCSPKQGLKHSVTECISSQSSISLSKAGKQGSTLKINSKSQIKGLFIRNTIKGIIGSQLAMNNREAIEAVKKCCFNNFVSKIDLSFNELTQKFITQLKREKLQSKFIKKIVVKGIKIDMRELKKEGFSIEVTPRGQSIITIGDILVQF